MTEIRTIKIVDIAASSIGNIRKNLGNLEELAASIKAHGILQPITVRNVEGFFQIVFGHRRIAAAKLAKLAEVPAIVVEATEDGVIELQLIENIQRADIHPLDEAIGFFRLREDYDRKVEDITKATGKSKAYIYAALKLVELSDFARDEFRKGKFDASIALYIARLKTDEAQKEAIKTIVKGDWQGNPTSAREAFKIVDALKEKIELDEKWAKKLVKIEKAGEKVLSKTAAAKVFSSGYVRSDSGYVDLDAVDYEHIKTPDKPRNLLKKKLPAIIHGQDPDTRKFSELITATDYHEALKALLPPGTKPTKASKLPPEVKKAQDKATAFRKFRAQALPLATEKALKGPSTNFLRAVLALAVEAVTFTTFNNALLKPYERKEADFKKSIATLNEKELRDELFALFIGDTNSDKFANVCKLLKVSDASLAKVKERISADAKAKAQAAKEREKAKAAKAKADKK